MNMKARSRVPNHQASRSRGRRATMKAKSVTMQKRRPFPIWRFLVGGFMVAVFIVFIKVGVTPNDHKSKSGKLDSQNVSKASSLSKINQANPKVKFNPTGPGSWAKSMKESGADKNAALLARQARVKNHRKARRNKKSTKN